MGARVPYETEIGYIGDERFLVRPILEPVHPEAATSLPGSSLPSGNWVVTGGGRGITHYLMKQAALAYGLNLHILGSSPLPELDPQIYDLDDSGREAVREQVRRDAHAAGQNPADALRQFDRTLDLGAALHTLQREGISVTYHQCDVAERAQIAEVLQQIRQQSGAITGILHGAGIEVSCRMENKDLSIVEKTYAIKVDAAAALMELTQNDPVKHFIGFGSIAGRMGSIGQSDYSMANDALAKLCDWYQTLRPECRVTCFHWGPWGEIGMAATPEMQANPILATMHLLSPEEGRKHFLNELVSADRTTETLLIDWGHYKLYYPDQQPVKKQTPKASSTVATAQKKPAPQPVPQSAAVAAAPVAAAPVAAAPVAAAPVAAAPVAAAPVAAAPAPQTAGEPAAASAPLSAIRRMVVRWVDGTTDAIAENLTIAGVAMIVGSNRDAQTLAETLAQYGVQTALVDTCDDEARLMGELDRVWAEQGPVSHLFLMTGRDAEAIRIAEREAWASRRKSGFFAPFHLLRHWLRRLTEAGWLDRAVVVAATAMNGDFGIESGSPALESSGLAGLLKAIHLEHGGKDRDGLTVKICDFSTQEEPAQLTACLLSELATGGFDIESAYVNGERRVPRLLNMEVPPSAQHSIPRGSTWVVTGGARGITAEVVKELGSHFGLKLHLLGSSPAPEIDEALRSLTEAELKQHKRVIVKQALSEGKSPEKEWNRLRHALEMDKNLREMQARQIDVTYHQCDLTDPARVAQVFQEIQRVDGPVCGMIHGAGIDGNPATVRNMLDSQFDVADRLIAIKVDAVLEMLRQTDPNAFRYFIGFGSISGRFGSAHASSYCSGNDMLCKIMGNLRRERPHCRAVGIHWHAWGEIGMMTRPVSYGSIKVLKMQLMPPADGVRHLIRELEAGLPENEIVITDSQYYSQFYSEKLLLASDAAVLPSLGRKPAAPDQGAGEKKGTTFPIVHQIHPVPNSSSELIGEAIFFPESDPFLIDHRFRGRPLLPAVITMEAFAETVQQMFPDKHIVAIHDLELLRGLTFSSETAVSVQISADTAGNLVACELVCPFYNRAGQLVDPHRVYATGIVEISSEPAAFESLPVSAPEGECHAIQYADVSAMMYHGPVFQQARDIIFSETQGIWAHLDVAPIELLAGKRNAFGWMLNPATVDACLYLCGAYVWLQNDGAVGLPKRIQQFSFGRLPRSGETCLLSVVPTSTGDGELIFNLTCYGDDGKAIFSIMNYHCQIVRASLRK
jgi:NAD(P)-dependent dehydrogenase (short-subunit alcohol dehydrogenase family)